MASLSSPVDSRPISGAESPSLRTYGTYGTIQRSLATGIDELSVRKLANASRHDQLVATSRVDTASFNQNPSDSLQESPLMSLDLLSPETLQLESSWADGTYDRALTEARFDWPDRNYGLDTNYDWIYSAFDNN